MDKTRENQREVKNVVIPAEVWDSKELTWMEKCIFAEIDSLDGKERGCFASNAYLAERMSSTPKNISSVISKLKKLGFVTVALNNSNGDERSIRVVAKRIPYHPTPPVPTGVPPSTHGRTPQYPRAQTVVPYIRELVRS